MKSTELVTHEVVMGHGPPHAKVFELAPVGGSPEVDERKLAMVVDEGGIGGRQRLGADIVVRDPG